ncbi:hypothetical protein BKI52_16610 [marine bacterium AO1-C]|nr:hypothetical protein BKI52_16610 [marine bacterium AO1-C]
MTNYNPSQAPVLFLIFKRFDTTLAVIKQIRKAKPRKLYIAADGPRNEILGEREECTRLRETVLNLVDWDCELKTLFREKNLTAKVAISEAIHWFFEHEESGIILEDDCVPHLTFFSFCSQLLEKYSEDSRVMHISGSNLLNGKTYGDGSYFFSRHVNIWGWATWRRAWKYYDLQMSTFQKFEAQNQIYNIMQVMYKRYHKRLKRVYENANTSTNEWDYPWTYTVFAQGGLSITPNQNLISNIGFGDNAGTTLDPNNPIANLPTLAIEEVKHPTFMLPFREADEKFIKITAGRPSIRQQLRVFLYKQRKVFQRQKE